ncbi:hypothetical protein EDM02_04840 [Candidatus Cardinium hertigii]|uniref:Uncharacterized protein n=1 Tax=Candidatus Cardinium hertigii TaxID=247481 RepID=A0A3N2QAX5_9BACT|nr:hypothetical protein EDM02_04840 [Candidatus Cardinium hertigii]
MAIIVENFHVKNPALLASSQFNGREGLFSRKELVVGLFPILKKAEIVNVLTLDSLEPFIQYAYWIDERSGEYDKCKQWVNSALKELEVALNLDLLTAYTFPLLMKCIRREGDTGCILSSRSSFLKKLKNQNILTQDNFQLLLTTKIPGPFFTKPFFTEPFFTEPFFTEPFFTAEARLESMELLFGAGLLTEHNLQVLLSHEEEEVEEVNITLQVLTELGLLTQGMFQVIMESKLEGLTLHHRPHPQGKIFQLDLDLNMLVSNPNPEAINRPPKILFFKDIIMQLNTAGLFTAANFKLLFASKLSMGTIINRIRQLKSANVFTEDELQLLLKSSL